MFKAGDIFGDGVNIAARLEGLADPGGICVTRGVRDHLRDRVGARFEDLGEHAVKNIARPVRVFNVEFDKTVAPEASVAMGDGKSASERNAFASEGVDVEIAFWKSVATSDTTTEYEIYLDRYPNGQFAELARHRMEGPKITDTSPAELAFWETVREVGDKALLAAYLDKYPNGQFADLAVLLRGKA